MNKKYLNTAAAMAVVCLFTAPTTATEQPDNEYLDMDLHQLMQVTITTVAKKPQTLADAAAAVYVITQEDIRRSGVTSVPEALAMAPGLQVARISSSKWSISSRGFAGYTSNKLLVLIDGRTVYSPAYSGTFWDQQHTLLEDIDRIEVIRGPGGTLWGANAVNGVINIITKDAEQTQGGLLRAGIGSEERATGAARYGSKLGESTYGRLYITYNDRDSNVLDQSGTDGNDGWQQAQGGFRFDGKAGVGGEWTLQGDLYANSEDQILFPYWIEQPPYLTAKYGEIDANGSNILGRWHREFKADSTLTFQAYYDYNDREEDYYQQTFKTIDAELLYETLLYPGNSLTTGAGYRRVEGDFQPTFQVFLPDRTDELYSAFVQDEITLIKDNLWLTLGTKYEHNEFTGSEWQPSGRLLWKPLENHSVWASIARAVRTPTMVEAGGRVMVGAFPTPIGTGTTSFLGNPDFHSEEVIAYEAGYRWQATPTLGLDLAFFYNDYSDLYTVTPVTNLFSTDFTFINAVVGEGYGGEAVIDWNPTRDLSLALTYSYLHLSFDLEDDIGLNVFNDFLAKASPKHQASLRGSYQLTNQIQLNLWLRYVDQIMGRSSLDLIGTSIPVDQYVLFDANLIWSPLDTLEVMLAVQNLIEEERLQYISEFTTPATAIERGVFTKLTWRF